MFDKELLFRDGTTDLTATMTGGYIQIPRGQFPLEFRLIVPTMAETGDKVVATLTYSDDGVTAREVVNLPDQITFANVVTNRTTEYAIPLFMRNFVSLTLTITNAGGLLPFNAGKVLAGIVPAGRHNKVAYP